MSCTVSSVPALPSSDSRGGNEWHRESAKGRREDVLGDSASNTDPGVFVCKACNESVRSPRPSAGDLVGLHNLAFGHWSERVKANGFKVTRDPTGVTSLYHSLRVNECQRSLRQ